MNAVGEGRVHLLLDVYLRAMDAPMPTPRSGVAPTPPAISGPKSQRAVSRE